MTTVTEAWSLRNDILSNEHSVWNVHHSKRVKSVSKYKISREIARKKWKQCTYHVENYPILVCRLVAEERGKSELLDSTLSGGLWGRVGNSGCRRSCDGT